jgi:6-phosphofructokinase 2
MIGLLRSLQVTVVLDAAGAALRHGLRARPWLAKPNRHEAEELIGRRLRTIAQVAHAARLLAVRMETQMLISLGAEGAVLAVDDRAEVLWAKPPRVKVNSAVGAGDSLVAGFLLGWLRTHSRHQAFRLGVACGTACAMTPGTELCHRRDVERLEGRIVIRTI